MPISTIYEQYLKTIWVVDTLINFKLIVDTPD